MGAPPTMEQAETRGLLAKKGEEIHTFSNGTEWDCWAEGNCYRCRFYDRDVMGQSCAFEGAAFMRMASGELASLFGWTQSTTEYGPRSGWDAPESCRFFRDADEDGNDTPDAPEPDPTQLILLADPTEGLAAFSKSAVQELELTAAGSLRETPDDG